jgi:hypothetical protein
MMKQQPIRTQLQVSEIERSRASTQHELTIPDPDSEAAKAALARHEQRPTDSGNAPQEKTLP